MRNIIRRITDKTSIEVKYTLTLFLITRAALTVIGVISRVLVSPLHMPTVYSKTKWLAIWGEWDTGWYLRIANDWYPAKVNLSCHSNYGFFPLYPALVKIISFFTLQKYLAGIIVSNTALFLSAIILYRLVRLDFDEKNSLRAIKYLFFFPAGFLFSAVLSESLFLCFALLSFYYARKDNWLLAGSFGFLLSVTRPFGVLIIIPLLLEYLQNKGLRFSKIRPDLFFLGLIPLGLFSFLLYCYARCGNPFAYCQTKLKGWGLAFGNPCGHLIKALTSGDITLIFSIYFTLIILFLLFYKNLRASYRIFAIILVLAPLFFERIDPNGSSVFNGAIRYSAVIFPLYIILAKISEVEWVDQCLSILLALFQGFLMVFWTNKFSLVI